MKYSSQDLEQFALAGVTADTIDKQVNTLKKGFPFLKINKPANGFSGILRVFKSEEEEYINSWNDYCSNNKQHKPKGKIVKFVPASGAASRMFKDLYEFKNDKSTKEPNGEVKRFFDHILDFPFYDELNERCVVAQGNSVVELIEKKDYRSILETLLDKDGMAYGLLPKGLLSFHKYADEVRTPCDEQLVEGALYATAADKVANIHFTVSHEHRSLFDNHIKAVMAKYEERYGVKYSYSFSEQKASTDTVALASNGELVRNADGSLLFRPAGHGALIENLNDIDADVVFIKNIDNVVTDRLKDTTIYYKRLLAGVLVYSQQVMFSFLRRLENKRVTDIELVAMDDFTRHVLGIDPANNKLYKAVEIKEYLRYVLNRPLRVCGMVKNEGEPGGGPYLVENSDGTISPQILESSQIDKNNTKAVEYMKQSQFFNPVDLVCGLKNYKGEKFDLTAYVDPSTGFISEKSKEGKTMKVLELPGLWNGAMSNWNTIFVEVPVATFNPVKTVNDLLREQHR